MNALCLGVDANGKKIIKFLGHPVNDNQKTVYYRGKDYPIDMLIKIPCGKCVGCRLEYSRQWANRCMLELQYHDSAYFCTFTYDDDHVPRTYYPDPETGEAFPAMTLQKRDFQLLMKRIRKHFPDDQIRFFACGEYGSQTFRPHYHAIIFGLHLSDLIPYKKVREGGEFYTYYNSPSLQECWPYGFVVVGEVTWESCAYTARYVMKKLKGKEAVFYETHNIQPEFTLMSRKPGIAREYYDTHPDLFDYDKINISTPKGGKSFRPPRYFEKLFEVDQPLRSAELKEIKKRMAIESQKAKLTRTSLTGDELLEVEEAAQVNKLKSLRRSLHE
jgi:hypothetical protein